MANVVKPITLSILTKEKPHRSNSELQARKKAENALKIAKNSLKPPKWLGKIAKNEFNYIVKQTETINLLNNLDLHALAIYANTYEEYVKVSQRIALDGPIVDTNKASDTVMGAHPLYVKQEKLLQSLRMLMNDLGLSPTARSKISLHLSNQALNESKTKSEFEDL